jgi:DNA-binding MarR family transcriptional regulator
VPKWLSAEEQRVWRGYLRATRLVDVALDAQLQAEAGMPHAYYEILVWLSESPQRSSRMSELAAATNSSPSRLSHAVARLEERGWVRREPCPSDRRGQVAVLTDDGFAALAAAAPGHVARVRSAIIDALTPDQLRQLGAICDRISAALET